MKLGDKVQVHKIVMAQGAGLDPMTRWEGGYTLEGVIDGVAVVKVGSGLYAGCLVNYALSDVRVEA